jgi:hypothetical protein
MRIHLLPDQVQDSCLGGYSAVGLTRVRPFSAILVSRSCRARADWMQRQLLRLNRRFSRLLLIPVKSLLLIFAVVSLYKGW